MYRFTLIFLLVAGCASAPKSQPFELSVPPSPRQIAQADDETIHDTLDRADAALSIARDPSRLIDAARWAIRARKFGRAIGYLDEAKTKVGEGIEETELRATIAFEIGRVHESIFSTKLASASYRDAIIEYQKLINANLGSKERWRVKKNLVQQRHETIRHRADATAVRHFRSGEALCSEPAGSPVCTCDTDEITDDDKTAVGETTIIECDSPGSFDRLVPIDGDTDFEFSPFQLLMVRDKKQQTMFVMGMARDSNDSLYVLGATQADVLKTEGSEIVVEMLFASNQFAPDCDYYENGCRSEYLFRGHVFKWVLEVGTHRLLLAETTFDATTVSHRTPDSEQLLCLARGGDDGSCSNNFRFRLRDDDLTRHTLTFVDGVAFRNGKPLPLPSIYTESEPTYNEPYPELTPPEPDDDEFD